MSKLGSLYSWIATQRLNKRAGRLNAEQISRLENIGMIWTVRNNTWEVMYIRAAAFHADNGHLFVPSNWKKDPQLAAWISNQRKERRIGHHTLTPERISKLDQIGMVWDTFLVRWEETFTMAKQFYKENGHLKVTKDYKLKCWIQTQRTAKTNGKLPPERQRRLEEIGMVWKVLDDHWEKMYLAAKSFYEIHGMLNIPASYKTADGLSLGVWISGQRQMRKKLLTVNDPKLQARVDRLNQIEMIWEASRRIYFTSFPEQAVLYYVRKAYPETHKMSIWDEMQMEIDVYIPEVRIGVEYDGIFHSGKAGSDAEKNRRCAAAGITLIRIREPGLPVLANSGATIDLADLTIESLGAAIRILLKMLEIEDIRMDINADRTDILDSYRDMNACLWDHKYEEAFMYYRKYGDLKIKHEPKENTASMRGWLTKQRRNYFDGHLTTFQTEKLMAIHFLDDAKSRRGTTPEPFPGDDTITGCESTKNERAPITEERGQFLAGKQCFLSLKWNSMFVLAAAYYDAFGNLLVPYSYLEEDGSSLGKWVLYQRVRRRKERISQLEIQMLDRIGMVWDVKQQALEQWLNAVRSYYHSHGHLNIPVDYWTKHGQALGRWLANQRSNRRAGLIKPEVEKALLQLDVSWNYYDSNWEIMFQEAKKFYKKNGHLVVPKHVCAPDGKCLQVWVSLQRNKYLKRSYSAGELNEEQITRLESIEIIWNPFDERWMKMYLLAKAYFIQHGHLKIPAYYTTPNGAKLGMWLTTQRTANRGNPNYCMTDWRRGMLDEIGIDWKPSSSGSNFRNKRFEK